MMKCICQSLYTNSDRPVFHIGIPGFFNRVIISIDDPVEIFGDFNCYFKQFLMIEFSINDKPGKRKGCQVTNGHFFRRSIFHYFCTEIAALDGTQVLLIAFPVGSIFIKQIGRAGFNLGFQNGKPEILGFYFFSCPSFFFITGI